MQIEKEKIYSGCDGEFKESFSDYPSSKYSLQVFIKRGIEQAVNLTITELTDDSFLIAYTQSQLQPGKNQYQYKFTNKETGRTLIPYSGFIQVAADISGTADTRSHARKMLDALYVLEEGRATKEILNNSYKGRSFQLLTPQEIREAVTYYEDIVQREENETRMNNGEQAGGRLLFGFDNYGKTIRWNNPFWWR